MYKFISAGLPSCSYRSALQLYHTPVIAVVITSQDSTSFRLLPGSSYSCCICNLHTLVHKQRHPVHFTTAHSCGMAVPVDRKVLTPTRVKEISQEQPLRRPQHLRHIPIAAHMRIRSQHHRNCFGSCYALQPIVTTIQDSSRLLPMKVNFDMSPSVTSCVG
jgi:hypothetical protein